MIAEAAGPSFTLEAADSAAFARLSGDFNPLHVDPAAARRLQFGGTVCHGVHLVMRALEESAASVDGLLLGLSVVFTQPVRSGAPVAIRVQPGADAGMVKLTGSVDGRTHFTIQATFGPAGATPPQPPHRPAWALAPPDEVAFPDDPARAPAGQLPWQLDVDLFRSMFPRWAHRPEGAAVAADLLASTHLVGMRNPGLHSIYSELSLQHRDVAGAAPATFEHAVTQVDRRFRRVRIDVNGGWMAGRLKAFFRAPPVTQRPLADLLALTRRGCTAGQRALVVGGSRGLGELTAKLLLAGGAEVCITHAAGRDDAQRIAAEASALGLPLTLRRLDLSQALTDADAAWLQAGRFTHLYHFASPPILKNTGPWDGELFDRFRRLYVDGLDALARAMAVSDAGQPTSLFYPSTVFLDEPARGFAEYGAAKAAGETLCRYLALDSARFRVTCLRLPRLQTDQNSSYMGVEGSDPLPVMAGALEAFCGWQAASSGALANA